MNAPITAQFNLNETILNLNMPAIQEWNGHMQQALKNGELDEYFLKSKTISQLSSLEIKWHILIQEVIQDNQQDKLDSNSEVNSELPEACSETNSSRLFSDKKRKLVSEQVEEIKHLHQKSQTSSKWKTSLIIVAVSLGAFMMLGICLMSSASLIAGAIILSISLPSIPVVLFLMVVASKDALKARIKCDKMIKGLVRHHRIKIQETIISEIRSLIGNFEKSKKKMDQLSCERSIFEESWKKMQNDEVEIYSLRSIIKANKAKILQQAKLNHDEK